MWSPPYTPPPIEKFSKPRWSVENTAKTQRVCDDLWKYRQMLREVTGDNSITSAIDATLRRIKQMDPNVILQLWD